jgi:hypothetical protein
VSIIRGFFAGRTVDLQGLGEWLDGLEDGTRIHEVRSLGGHELARLFDAAARFRKVSLDDFVPREVGPATEVIHHGRNSLAMFTTFEKRFIRPDDERRRDELWGYNHQPMSWATGPGYFVARPADDWEVVIDYFETPPPDARMPRHWPAVVPNDARLGRFVYHHTRDSMRGVSAHVSIGRAFRDNRPMDAWFILARAGSLH